MYDGVSQEKFLTGQENRLLCEWLTAFNFSIMKKFMEKTYER